MRKELERLGLALSILLLVSFVLFVINQTAQVVKLAQAVHPLAGQAVLYALLVVYIMTILVPLITISRLPKLDEPPQNPEGNEFAAYLARLAKRLASNPNLVGAEISASDRATIEAALKRLDTQANVIIKNTGSTVFLSTAISQSGRLDGLMVLMAQSRMVWRIMHLYYQRPSLSQIVRLYTNVAATTFVVSEVQDLDISEQIEPIIASALGGSLASAIPGVTIIANLLTSSILEGTANAFLTLRVGAICKQYCSALGVLDRRTTRRFASVEAASMLGGLVLDSSAAVSRSISNAARRAGVGTYHALTDQMLKGTQVIADRLYELNPLRKRAPADAVSGDAL
jgi:hypothetical protein